MLVDRVIAGDYLDNGSACDKQNTQSSKVAPRGESHCIGPEI